MVFHLNGCLREGEKLSPLMFSLYINDVEDYLLDKNVAALFTITKRIKKELFYIFNFFYPVLCRQHCYFSWVCLRFTVCLYRIYWYCDTWKLTVNINQTKIVVCSTSENMLSHISPSYVVLSCKRAVPQLMWRGHYASECSSSWIKWFKSD